MACTTVKGLHHPEIAAPRGVRSRRRRMVGAVRNCGWVGGWRADRRAGISRLRTCSRRRNPTANWQKRADLRLPCYLFLCWLTVRNNNEATRNSSRYAAPLVNQTAAFCLQCQLLFYARALEFSHHHFSNWVRSVRGLTLFRVLLWSASSGARVRLFGIVFLHTHGASSRLSIPLAKWFSSAAPLFADSLVPLGICILSAWVWLIVGTRERNLHAMSLNVNGVRYGCDKI